MCQEQNCKCKKPYYITTAIAYTSGKPHIGNTYEIVLADSTGVQHLNKEKIAAGPIKPVFFCQILQIICCMCCMFMI